MGGTLVKSLLMLFVCYVIANATSVMAQSGASSDLLKPGHPTVYFVKEGDTLWDIASVFLVEPWKWPEIWHVNTQIQNPHLIYPGDTLRLTYIDGAPKLVVKRSEISSELLHDGTLKLSPKPRIESIDSVIPAVPLDAIQSFLENHRVVDQALLEGAPRVIAGSEDRLVLGVGDTFYARGIFEEQSATYGVFRESRAFFDPVSGEPLGFGALRLGVGRVLNLSDDVAKISILTAKQDIRIGDRLLPTIERKVNSIFYPKPPNQSIEGYIIHVFGGVRNVSRYNVVVINKGEREDIEEGDILAIYRVGARIRDRVTNELIQLPSERAGLAIIFRTFEKVSFGLVIAASTIVTVGDQVQNP